MGKRAIAEEGKWGTCARGNGAYDIKLDVNLANQISLV